MAPSTLGEQNHLLPIVKTRRTVESTFFCFGPRVLPSFSLVLVVYNSPRRTSAMPTGCGVPFCPNRNSRSIVAKSKQLQYHLIPREEPLRTEWCQRIGRQDPGNADVRVCSEHFDGERDFLRIASVLRDAGQTMKRVHLKPGVVPSLRLPPFSKTTPEKEPPSKRPRIPVSCLTVSVKGGLK